MLTNLLGASAGTETASVTASAAASVVAVLSCCLHTAEGFVLIHLAAAVVAFFAGYWSGLPLVVASAGTITTCLLGAAG
jgi:hypothetical protein